MRRRAGGGGGRGLRRVRSDEGAAVWGDGVWILGVRGRRARGFEMTTSWSQEPWATLL